MAIQQIVSQKPCPTQPYIRSAMLLQQISHPCPSGFQTLRARLPSLRYSLDSIRYAKQYQSVASKLCLWS